MDEKITKLENKIKELEDRVKELEKEMVWYATIQKHDAEMYNKLVDEINKLK